MAVGRGMREVTLDVVPLYWDEAQARLMLLDQRRLPHAEEWLACANAAEVARAIREMVVRGAPAIGIAAAYGVALEALALQHSDNWPAALQPAIDQLAASRPTAVNLFWALKLMGEALQRHARQADLPQRLLQLAEDIHQADIEASLSMGQLGAELIARHDRHPQRLMTHCNAGALATGGYGTALGVIRAAHAAGLVECVHVNETRPWLQGSRLTAWELLREDIPLQLNVDSAAAHLLKAGDISWVIVGADRIAANGDVANKIGTYALAVQAMHHGARFMVVAPTSTIDMQLDCGEDIPIEERDAEELLVLNGQPLTVPMPVCNPVFDVTPADLIDVLVTEKGIVERPDADSLAALMSRDRLH
ncbi:methylthioribose-1-phosphate isomerase [Halopseudomonas yangmingensis]|uniref:Methylthioribose-1-phosphate isomerase n=2 Tax=Halopseudomonas yangmingensis TaxID=1720063 RepID=A0A1I4S6E6_9GAMM|nr:methylthioribose-1-phosphate isomerase [Halopseudomonas yangmingensis]